MTDDRKRKTGGEVELLPLPKTWRIAQHGADFIEVHTAEQMEAYARANVDRALAESRAEVEQVERQRDAAHIGWDMAEKDHAEALARAERLAVFVESMECECDSFHGHRCGRCAALSLEPNP